MVDFGNRLKTLRLQKGLTQKELAQQVGLTKSVISAYETGIRMPSYATLILIARIFKVSTDYLLGADTRSSTSIDISGLTDAERAAVKALIKSMRE